MKAHVKWIEGDLFMGQANSGHAIIMEASDSKTNAGPSPLEMLLMGMGACASSDVVTILKKMCQSVGNVTVEMEAKRADKIPRVFTKIHAIFTVAGKSVSFAKAEEAVQLSGKKNIALFPKCSKKQPKLRLKRKSLKSLKRLLRRPSF